jgi:hypothetical protein
MTRAWSPADGPDIAPQQRPRVGVRVRGDGSTERAEGRLWVPSEGPLRQDPGGAGGEPSGKALPVPGLTALNEQ